VATRSWKENARVASWEEKSRVYSWEEKSRVLSWEEKTSDGELGGEVPCFQLGRKILLCKLR